MSLHSDPKRLTVIGASGAAEPPPAYTHRFAGSCRDLRELTEDLEEVTLADILASITIGDVLHQTHSVVLDQREPAATFLEFFLCWQVGALPIPSEPALAWLPEVYAHVEHGDDEAAADMVFDAVDDMLSASEFRRCDELLQMVDVARLNPNLMISFLAVTLPAKERLPSRVALLRRIEERLEKLAPGRVDALLQTLR